MCEPCMVHRLRTWCKELEETGDQIVEVPERHMKIKPQGQLTCTALTSN